MAKEGRSGITTNTPNNILFGAGTIHKNLKYENGSWNFADTFVGATSGGSKVSFVPEVTPLELDGADVRIAELDVKTGETGSMEINFAELTKDILQAALFAEEGTSEDDNYTLLETKEDIEVGDYWENIAYVGTTIKGKNIIVIMENAICTSGLNHEGKAKEGSVGAYTFEPRAALDGNHRKLPIKIYYPKTTD